MEAERKDWAIDPGLVGVLPGDLIRELLRHDPPLVAGLPSPDEQVQPNGIDLTLAEVHRFVGAGRVTVDNRDRVLPPTEPVPWDGSGIAILPPGAYHIVYNETVHLPLNVMGLARPRSSVGRCGAMIHTSIWDAGYRGRSTSLLVVANPNGFGVQRGARVTQLVFLSLVRPASAGYAGAYQGENLPRT